MPGAFLEKSSDHTRYVTHAHCMVNLGYYCNQVEFQSLSHSSGVHPSQHTAVKTPCALVMCANAQEYVGAVLKNALIAGFAACDNAGIFSLESTRL